MQSEHKLGVVVTLCIFVVAFTLASIWYGNIVTVPLEMADKGFCYVTLAPNVTIGTMQTQTYVPCVLVTKPVTAEQPAK
jgi:hypothetical protein